MAEEIIPISRDTDKISVDRQNLGAILKALVGPDYLIRELQYTMSLPNNPIKELVDEYNTHVDKLAAANLAGQKAAQNLDVPGSPTSAG